MTNVKIKPFSVEWIERAWRFPDIRGIAAALAVLIVGAVTIGLTVDVAGRATPMTGLLVVATLLYGIISNRLKEFTAPGGWSAKFAETAEKSIQHSSAVLEYTPFDVNQIPKGDPILKISHLTEIHDDARPLVLTLTLGKHYESTSFASLLATFASVPNYRGVAILDESGKLIAYSSARQISWLGSMQCEALRQNLLNYIESREITNIVAHIAMSVATASNGSSYADVLEKTLSENLSCIAIVDKNNKLRGLVDRDRLSANLVLSLAYSAQDRKYTSDDVE